MHVFLSKKYIKSLDLTSPCTEELLSYKTPKDPGLLLHPKHVLVLCVWLQIPALVLLLLGTQNSGQCPSDTNTELDQVLCTDKALQAEVGLCLPQIQSIFHPEEQTTLFGVNSLLNVIPADSQQQSHRCLFSLWVLTVTATQEMTLVAPGVAILVAGMVDGSLCADTALLSCSGSF